MDKIDKTAFDLYKSVLILKEAVYICNFVLAITIGNHLLQLNNTRLHSYAKAGAGTSFKFVRIFKVKKNAFILKSYRRNQQLIRIRQQPCFPNTVTWFKI